MSLHIQQRTYSIADSSTIFPVRKDSLSVQYLLQFPSQMASVLRSHHLTHLFSVCSEPSSIVRFTYWLEHSLGYGMVWEHAHMKYIVHVCAQVISGHPYWTL